MQVLCKSTTNAGKRHRWLTCQVRYICLRCAPDVR